MLKWGLLLKYTSRGWTVVTPARAVGAVLLVAGYATRSAGGALADHADLPAFGVRTQLQAFIFHPSVQRSLGSGDQRRATAAPSPRRPPCIAL